MAASGASRASGAWLDVLVKIARASDAELNANDNVVCFSDDYFVLEDAFPKAKTHWLVIPRDPALVGLQALDGLPDNTTLLRTMRALAVHALLHHAPAAALISPHFVAARSCTRTAGEFSLPAADAAPAVASAPTHSAAAPPARPDVSPSAAPTAFDVSADVSTGTACLPLSRCTVPAASEWEELGDSADDDCTVVATTAATAAKAPARPHESLSEAVTLKFAKFVPRTVFIQHAGTPSALFDPALPQPASSAVSAPTLARPSSRFRLGFHAIPSLRPLHLHVISRDLVSARLKNKSHYHSFASPFFVPVDDVIADIEARNAAASSRGDTTPLWRLPLILAASGRVKTRRHAVDESGRAAAAAAVAALERICAGPLVLFTDTPGGTGAITSAGTSDQFLTDAALLALADGTEPVLGAGSGAHVAANMPALKRLLDERERG